MSNSPVIVPVNLPGRAYDIHIGHGLLHDFGRQLAARCPARRATVITDSNVERLSLATLTDTLRAANIESESMVIPVGEASKSLTQLSRIYDELAKRRHGRDEPIVALGGGVVGDLAGFAAATWLRGVPFVQCPTTLEAMIDASIGGKTGINHAAGKNLIGAFHQPLWVCIDPAYLATLSPRDVTAALAESIKHAVIADPGFLAWHEANIANIRSLQNEAMVELIARNCRIKAAIIEQDERETAVESVGRAALNFGHTAGHAIEAQTNYALRHGEAVALGMVAAMELSVRSCGLAEVDRQRVETLLGAVGLSVRCDHPLDVENLLVRLGSDKKVRSQQVRFVAVPRLGVTSWLIRPNPSDVRAALARLA